MLYTLLYKKPAEIAFSYLVNLGVVWLRTTSLISVYLPVGGQSRFLWDLCARNLFRANDLFTLFSQSSVALNIFMLFLYYLPTSLKGLLLWVLLVCSFRADKLRNIRLNSIKNLCSVFDWIKRSSQLWISHGEFPIVKEHPKGRIEAEAVIFRNRTPKPKRDCLTWTKPRVE